MTNNAVSDKPHVDVHLGQIADRRIHLIITINIDFGVLDWEASEATAAAKGFFCAIPSRPCRKVAFCPFLIFAAAFVVFSHGWDLGSVCSFSFVYRRINPSFGSLFQFLSAEDFASFVEAAAPPPAFWCIASPPASAPAHWCLSPALWSTSLGEW